MKKILNILRKDDIGEPPWEYYFLQHLDEKEYPKYLAKIFNYRTGEKLPLLKELSFKSGEWGYKINKNKLKTFNQKIQWIKLYGITDLMRYCTNKVTVRDYVKERIGGEYLKPVLQICDNFDEIDFEKLPNAFVLKCNHGSKWQYIIKNKEQFLHNKPLFDIVKRNMTGWLEQEFWVWEGFELQYKGIKPKILIEPLMRDDINKTSKEIMIYFFNNKTKIIIKTTTDNEITIWDEKFNIIDDPFNFKEQKINEDVNDLINQTFDLSNKLIKNLNFSLVRVDWLIYKNKPYFEEFTFTPYSGFLPLKKQKNIQLGKLITI